MMRVSLALPFLFFVAWKEGSLPKIDRRNARYMLLLGLLGVALPQTLVFEADKLAGPNAVAIMTPVVNAAIFASALKLERLTRVKVGGVSLAVAGALVILWPDKIALTNGRPDEIPAGICVIVIQTMWYAALLVALKIKLQTHPNPFGLYAYASLTGAIVIAFAGVVSGSIYFDPNIVPRSAWFAVLNCGFAISFFAHACQSWAVAHTSASFPSLFNCLSPSFTGFLAHVFLEERLGLPSDIMGLPLNVSGLFAVVFSKMRLEGPMSAIATASDKDTVNEIGMDAVLPDTVAPPAGRLSLSRMDDLTLDPAEYLATKRLGSLKWLVEPASSSVPPPKPVSLSPDLPVHRCVCCETQAGIFEQHVAQFLTSKEFATFSTVIRRPLVLSKRGEVRCLDGPLVPPFGLNICANDGPRTAKDCHHHPRVGYVQQPLRTEGDDHVLYWLDVGKPQRILEAGGARGEGAQRGDGAARRISAIKSGSECSTLASLTAPSNAQISSLNSNGRTTSSKQRPSGGKEDREEAERMRAQVRLPRLAATLLASLMGGGVMMILAVWQQRLKGDLPRNNGIILLLALYALVGLACSGVGLWIWQMYSDRQRLMVPMPTASMNRRTRGKGRDPQHVGSGHDRHAPDRPRTRNIEEAQCLIESDGNNYGSGRGAP
ncbi:hypothetical protein VYU27_003688 [Nannochloropsis oceanica]